MLLKPAVLVFNKDKGKGIKNLFGTQPHKAAMALVNIWLIAAGILFADTAADAIRSNHQIGIIFFGRRHLVGDLGIKDQLDPNLFTARLQDVKQLFAPNANKPMALAADAAPLEVGLDIIPVIKRIDDLLGRNRISRAQIFHGGIRKYHPPTKGVIRAVSLDDRHLVVRVLQLHEQTEIQSSRPTTDADNVHNSPHEPVRQVVYSLG